MCALCRAWKIRLAESIPCAEHLQATSKVPGCVLKCLHISILILFVIVSQLES